MKKSYIRINNIEIRKFKNISYGKLKFDNNRKSFKASVLGLYGQNGSGKTALIDALEILKYALTGKSVPAKFAEYINIDSEFAQFKFEFTIKHDDDSEYIAIYELNLNRIEEENQGNIDTEEQNVKTYRVSLSNERISCSYKSHEKSAIMQTIVDTNTDEIFLPKKKFDILIGKNKDTYNKLLLYKKLISLSSRSFIFSREFINVIRQNCNEIYLLNLFNDLILYGNYELFIINTNQSNLISFDALPISFRLEEAGQASFGRIAINLNDTTSVPQDAFDLVCKLIENMNIVLVQLIPGLKIKVKNLGANLTEKGEPAFQLQLLSCRNDKEIPLRNESEGIKKIVSILQLLIVMYNDPSITVAIDELDSGVFEYLLGEILNIISERGLGQLIFTSHNLRPLETLDYGFIAFTTTNPENRYIRIKNKKSNNNLRDLYYRNIILDEQSETLYDATNNGSIAFAFRDAGLTHEK